MLKQDLKDEEIAGDTGTEQFPRQLDPPCSQIL